MDLRWPSVRVGTLPAGLLLKSHTARMVADMATA